MWVVNLKAATCHPEREHDSKGLCKSCYEKQRINLGISWRQINPEAYKEARRNRDKRVGTRKRVLQKYHMTLEDYEDKLKSQNYGCEICGVILPILAVDEDHNNNNKVRGLLCKNHNAGLGLFNDDPELLRKAAKYIEKYR